MVKHPSFINMIVQLLSVLLYAVCLSHVYRAGASIIKTPWLGAAIINTFFAIVVITAIWRRSSFLEFEWRIPTSSKPRLWTMLPAASIIIGTLALGVISSFFGNALPAPVQLQQVLLITWIPIIEEVVFRRGFSQYYMSKLGALWGCYVSALLFAMAHADFTIDSIMKGSVGLPLGPFLLGLCTSYIMYKTQSLLGPILLHSACNATVVILSLLDARWFSWLYYLYH